MGQALCPCMFARRYTISKAGKNSSVDTRGGVAGTETSSATPMTLRKHTDDNANSMPVLEDNTRNGLIKNSQTKNGIRVIYNCRNIK